MTTSNHAYIYIKIYAHTHTHTSNINTHKCFQLTAHLINNNDDTTEQQQQLDENGEVIATIEGHELQPEEAEEIDNENAAIIHDDQQPLTGFGGAAHSASMTSSFNGAAHMYSDSASVDR